MAENITVSNEEKIYCKHCLNKSFKSEENLRNHMLSCLENKLFNV